MASHSIGYFEVLVSWVGEVFFLSVIGVENLKIGGIIPQNILKEVSCACVLS